VRGGLGGQLTTEEAVPMREHAGAPAVRRGGWRSRSNDNGGGLSSGGGGGMFLGKERKGTPWTKVGR
jgi:hypothetical protein